MTIVRKMTSTRDARGILRLIPYTEGVKKPVAADRRITSKISGLTTD